MKIDLTDKELDLVSKAIYEWMWASIESGTHTGKLATDLFSVSDKINRQREQPND